MKTTALSASAAKARWAALVILSLVFSACDVCEAQPKLPSRTRSRSLTEQQRTKEWTSQHSLGVQLSVILLLVVLLPPIISFFYNVYRDPATPTVLRNASELLSERTLGFLSARGGKTEKKTR